MLYSCCQTNVFECILCELNSDSKTQALPCILHSLLSILCLKDSPCPMKNPSRTQSASCWLMHGLPENPETAMLDLVSQDLLCLQAARSLKFNPRHWYKLLPTFPIWPKHCVNAEPLGTLKSSSFIRSSARSVQPYHRPMQTCHVGSQPTN